MVAYGIVTDSFLTVVYNENFYVKPGEYEFVRLINDII